MILLLYNIQSSANQINSLNQRLEHYHIFIKNCNFHTITNIHIGAEIKALCLIHNKHCLILITHDLNTLICQHKANRVKIRALSTIMSMQSYKRTSTMTFSEPRGMFSRNYCRRFHQLRFICGRNGETLSPDSKL